MILMKLCQKNKAQLIIKSFWFMFTMELRFTHGKIDSYKAFIDDTWRLMIFI